MFWLEYYSKEDQPSNISDGSSHYQLFFLCAISLHVIRTRAKRHTHLVLHFAHVVCMCTLMYWLIVSLSFKGIEKLSLIFLFFSIKEDWIKRLWVGHALCQKCLTVSLSPMIYTIYYIYLPLRYSLVMQA